MPLIIKNGTIVTADAQFTGDILCDEGVIKQIGPDLSAPSDSEIIDATGKLVFPGFNDPHVHIYLPFMGTFSKDDYATGSKAALMGGTTTLIEMCCPARSDDPREAIRLWKSKAAGISSCDYTFHMGVTRFDEGTADALPGIGHGRGARRRKSGDGRGGDWGSGFRLRSPALKSQPVASDRWSMNGTVCSAWDG